MQLLRSPIVQVSVLYGVAGAGFVLANLLLARALSPGDYAEVTLLIALIGLVYPLASLELGEIVVRQALAATGLTALVIPKPACPGDNAARCPLGSPPQP